MVVLWRIELSNTKPELSQGERAQYWDTCVAALAFVYCYTYEAYGAELPLSTAQVLVAFAANDPCLLCWTRLATFTPPQG